MINLNWKSFPVIWQIIWANFSIFSHRSTCRLANQLWKSDISIKDSVKRPWLQLHLTPILFSAVSYEYIEFYGQVHYRVTEAMENFWGFYGNISENMRGTEKSQKTTLLRCTISNNFVEHQKLVASIASKIALQVCHEKRWNRLSESITIKMIESLFGVELITAKLLQNLNCKNSAHVLPYCLIILTETSGAAVDECRI